MKKVIPKLDKLLKSNLVANQLNLNHQITPKETCQIRPFPPWLLFFQSYGRAFLFKSKEDKLRSPQLVFLPEAFVFLESWQNRLQTLVLSVVTLEEIVKNGYKRRV
jgi:hypothetical protein